MEQFGYIPEESVARGDTLAPSAIFDGARINPAVIAAEERLGQFRLMRVILPVLTVATLAIAAASEGSVSVAWTVAEINSQATRPVPTAIAGGDEGGFDGEAAGENDGGIFTHSWRRSCSAWYEGLRYCVYILENGVVRGRWETPEMTLPTAPAPK
ncbi:MAG: hypothetical protein HYS86_02035 [Candidatus Chisholmbacteria bacterium]|nr:hypothetical protein [Candidatus Chisholmbacteria bacterium]